MFTCGKRKLKVAGEGYDPLWINAQADKNRKHYPLLFCSFTDISKVLSTPQPWWSLFSLHPCAQTYTHDLIQLILTGSNRHTQFTIIWKLAAKCLWYTVKWREYFNIMSNMWSTVNVVNKTSSLYTLVWFGNELCNVPWQPSAEKNDYLS